MRCIWCDCVQVVGLYLGDPYDRRNSLTVNDLGRLGRRKSLIVSNLRKYKIKQTFFRLFS